MKIRLTLLAAGLIAVSPMALAQVVKHKHLDCAKQIEAENKSFDANLKAHIADGKIDDNEKTALAKTHADLLAAEKKAMEDGKLSADECRAIHSKIVAERKQMNDAIGVRAKNHVATKKAFAGTKFTHIKDCSAEISREKNAFDTKMKAGLDSGKIDAKEKADIEKTHAELLALEKKAMDDGKISAEECKGIHTKIVSENKKLATAVDAIVKRPAHKKVSVLNKSKRGKPVAAKDLAACKAEVAKEKTTYAGDMDKLAKSGHLSAAEKTALDKVHAELVALEKKAMSDGKMTHAECNQIHAKIVEEHDKMVEADKS